MLKYNDTVYNFKYDNKEFVNYDLTIDSKLSIEEYLEQLRKGIIPTGRMELLFTPGRSDYYEREKYDQMYEKGMTFDPDTRTVSYIEKPDIMKEHPEGSIVYGDNFDLSETHNETYYELADAEKNYNDTINRECVPHIHEMDGHLFDPIDWHTEKTRKDFLNTKGIYCLMADAYGINPKLYRYEFGTPANRLRDFKNQEKMADLESKMSQSEKLDMKIFKEQYKDKSVQSLKETSERVDGFYRFDRSATSAYQCDLAFINAIDKLDEKRMDLVDCTRTCFVDHEDADLAKVFSAKHDTLAKMMADPTRNYQYSRAIDQLVSTPYLYDSGSRKFSHEQIMDINEKYPTLKEYYCFLMSKRRPYWDLDVISHMDFKKLDLALAQFKNNSQRYKYMEEYKRETLPLMFRSDSDEPISEDVFTSKEYIAAVKRNMYLYSKEKAEIISDVHDRTAELREYARTLDENHTALTEPESLRMKTMYETETGKECQFYRTLNQFRKEAHMNYRDVMNLMKEQPQIEQMIESGNMSAARLAFHGVDLSKMPPEALDVIQTETLELSFYDNDKIDQIANTIKQAEPLFENITPEDIIPAREFVAYADFVTDVPEGASFESLAETGKENYNKEMNPREDYNIGVDD